MNRKVYASALGLIIVALVFWTACGSSSKSTPPPPTVTITATSGSGQSATVSTAFANPLVATVMTNGSPTSGATVTFTAPGTGASGTFSGGTASTTATTNASGVASVTFTANATSGTYAVTASVTGATAPASFSLTNAAVPVVTITATSGSGQSATVSTAFANPLVATVKTNGSPTSGVTVTFTAPGTGASGTFSGGTNTATVTTDANGNASPTFTANTIAGTYMVTASATGATAPASFGLTNTAGAAASITAAIGTTPQSATVTVPFSPLGATVLDIDQNPVSGAVVTFTAPTTGPSGTFTGGTNTVTATTNASGVATVQLIANGTTGGPYTVTATVPGVSTAADFILTNTGGVYSFYLSGLESVDGGSALYALAGSVIIDAKGNVLGGEQDYNDGSGFSYIGSTIAPLTDALQLSNPATAPGQATLTLNWTNAALSANGSEILGVQFVNNSHALVVQFDGTATSSGSMDLQTLPSTLGGSYAFTFSGVDGDYFPTVSGGVFSISGTSLQNGFVDTNDAENGVTLGTPLSGTVSAPDSFGRGTITGVGPAINYYIIGPEAIRIIDVDADDSGVGSAFGQGTGTFTGASLGAPCANGQVCSVFCLESNSWGIATILYAAAGMFTATPVGTSGTILQGVVDNDEAGFFVNDVQITGSYSVSNIPVNGNGSAVNGYGSMTLVSVDSLLDLSTLGVYLTDPNLNLNDPNNTTSGFGGALIADMDSPLQGTGALIPQTDPSTASFAGNYAVGAQEYNNDSFWEFDFVGQGSVSSGVLTGTGLVSDPGLFFGADGTNGGVPFSGAATPDPSNAGRYTIPLTITVGGSPTVFDVVIYQAGGGQLFWLDEDDFSWFLGSLKQQGSLTTVPGAKKGAAAKTKSKPAASTAR